MEETVSRSFVRQGTLYYLMPSILLCAVPAISIFLDGLFVHNMLGGEEMAAFGIAVSYLFIVDALSGLIEVGGESRASYHNGSGDQLGYCRAFTLSMVYILLMGLIMMLLGVTRSREIAALLGARGNTVELAASYIFGISLFNIPFGFANLLPSFIRIDGSPALSMASLLVMTAVKSVCAWIFLGPLHMGMFGLAVAIGLGSLAGIATCVPHFFKRGNRLRLISLRGFAKELRKMAAIGLPYAGMLLGDGISVVILNYILMQTGGELALAAYAILSSWSTLLFAVSGGVAEAMRLMVSMYYGERNKPAMKSAVAYGLKLGLCITVPLAVAIFFLAEPMVHLFSVHDPAECAMAVRCLRFFCLTLVSNMVGLVITNYYQSYEHNALSTGYILLDNLVWQSLCAWLLAPLVGTDGVWVCFFLGEVLTFATLALYQAVRNRGKYTVNDCLYLGKKDWPEEGESVYLRLNAASPHMAQDIAICADFRADAAPLLRIASALAQSIKLHAGPARRPVQIDLHLRFLPDQNGLVHLWDNGKPFNPWPDAVRRDSTLPCAKDHSAAHYENIVNLNYCTVKQRKEQSS